MTSGTARAYYNENDPFAAAWLRELITGGLIADGEVDTRSIADVRSGDLDGFRQCHFFAGVGGWSLALRLAGWPDDRAVWTGSCPCQPFSNAGAANGADDPRHLWPTWFRLIGERRPLVVFGEQVASADGLGWFDRVSTDLEAENYAVGAADLCAPGVGAFHIRQRLWFVADADGGRAREFDRKLSGDESEHVERAQDGDHAPIDRGAIGRLADDDEQGRDRIAPSRVHERRPRTRGDEKTSRDVDGSQRYDVDGCRGSSNVGDTDRARCAEQRGHGGMVREATGADSRETALRTNPPSFWNDAEWLQCTDGKARPIEPGSFPLAHGVPGRVGRLRGYGNAIVPQVAALFIEAYSDVAEHRL